MARKERNDIDYFPHSVNHGKKMFYLRSKFKNDGYAVWFMLLEELGKSEYHYLNLSDKIQLMYLSANFMVDEIIVKDIINTLVEFGEFDKQLWEENAILFNEKFIDNISDAYKKRNNSCITRESLILLLESKGIRKPSKSNPKQPKPQSKAPVKPQTKVDYTKLEESIENIYSVYPTFCNVRNASTNKGKKDKDKIKKLLSSISEDKLIKTIEWYIADCKKSNTYIKNFSTFLNNLPDMDESKPSQEKLYSYMVHFTMYRNKTEKQYKEDLKRFGKDLILK